MSPTCSVNTGKELYIYVRGQLVMKFWLNRGTFALYQVAPNQVVYGHVQTCHTVMGL